MSNENENGFDPWAYKRYLLSTGDFEGFREASARAASAHPREYYSQQKAYGEEHMHGVVHLLSFFSAEQRQWILAVAEGYWRLIVAAQLGNWGRYCSFRESYQATAALTIEGMRRLLSAHAPAAEWSSVANELIRELDEGVNYYQKRLLYYCGLTQLAKNTSTSPDDLRKLDIASLERSLEKRVGRVGLLGEEYRHLRNALGHKSFRILNKDHTIRFTDHNPRSGATWERRYAFPEFMAIVSRLQTWMIADGIVQGMEGLLILSVFEASAKPVEDTTERQRAQEGPTGRTEARQ